TEGVLMENPEDAINKLNLLKAYGIQIAMDDFGVGYSSLLYLKNFPIDTIKIDRSFINEITHDSKVQTIISAIVNLAHELGLKVTAEGVETEQQLTSLKELSCDFV